MAEKSARYEGKTVKPHKNSKLRKRKDVNNEVKSISSISFSQDTSRTKLEELLFMSTEL